MTRSILQLSGQSSAPRRPSSVSAARPGAHSTLRAGPRPRPPQTSACADELSSGLNHRKRNDDACNERHGHAGATVHRPRRTLQTTAVFITTHSPSPSACFGDGHTGLGFSSSTSTPAMDLLVQHFFSCLLSPQAQKALRRALKFAPRSMETFIQLPNALLELADL